ncbi:cell wall elongation regulator TseB-like domain-containing protein [Paenibacillus athensensis]|uniref:cell wall elongation regulator TseB-like domain-containing protein n=1 Tax=Paenibacillus athensensis TaxID=1967502 RepID=UPI001E3B5910|nr:DUF5590 domain-containing protein [Paenibacillus athensensis]
MTWRRWTVLGLFIAATLIVVLARFYASVQGEHWRDDAQAVNTAYEKSILAKAERVESFYGDEPMHVVFGSDKIGQPVIVWVTANGIHTEMADEAVNEQQIREKMAAKDPALEVLRVLPGELGGNYVWEVFYKKKEAAGVRYFYDYYGFKDGAYLDTYRLSLQ